MRRKDFSEILKIFADKGCELHTSKVQYEEMKSPIRSIFNFKASCGHDNTVTLTNFVCKNSGVVCKSCMVTNMSKLLSDNTKHDDYITNFEKEYMGYKYVCSILEDDFNIKRTNEGCLADFVIKPKDIENDEWMMVQLKTCSGICHGVYSFTMQNDYVNCLVLCVCLENNNMWLLDQKKCNGIRKVNIGVTDKSAYFKYKCTDTELLSQLHTEYNIIQTFTKQHCMIPTSPCQQVEHHHRLLRENHLQFLNVIYPDFEGQKTDFYINSYNIQEKVATLKKNSNTLYTVELHKNNRKKDKKRQLTCYEKGDNDFYWIWLRDDNAFCIFPESILIAYEKIQVDNNLNDTKKGLCISTVNWTKDYQYKLDDKDLKEKLNTLFYNKNSC